MKAGGYPHRPKHPCADCAQPCYGFRCRSCHRATMPLPRGRPGYGWPERRRRKRAVEQWIAEFGWVCPGWKCPAHAAVDLTADHVAAVGAGGDEDGDLSVLCRQCNSAKRDGGRRRRTLPKPSAAPAVRAAAERTARPRQPETEPTPAVPREAPMTAAKKRKTDVAPPRDVPPPPAPEGVSPDGREFWAATTEAYEMAEHELLLLEQIVRTKDRIAELDALVEREGLMLQISPVNIRLHPAVAEARNQRLALARQLATLRLPEGEQDEDAPVKRPQRRGAARAPYQVRVIQGGRS